MKRRKTIDDVIRKTCSIVLKRGGRDAIDDFVFCTDILSKRASNSITYEEALQLLTDLFDDVSKAKKVLDRFEREGSRYGRI
ncbi:MAG: hypothetical protein DRO39_05020 [Thermoprotei archaeon]|nr:MAG: hypothetical protein DRO39_05020 [Thermoprotei archaeon]